MARLTMYPTHGKHFVICLLMTGRGALQMNNNNELLDSTYLAYISKFGHTFNPLGLSGEIWQATEVLMLQALLGKGEPVTLERIWQYWRSARENKNKKHQSVK